MKENSIKELAELETVIRANICKPRPEETHKFTIERKLRASPSMEGDSQIGITLFVGVANDMGFAAKDIMRYLSVEEDIFRFRLKKYEKSMEKTLMKPIGKLTRPRFQNKVSLIKNHYKTDKVRLDELGILAYPEGYIYGHKSA